MGEIRGAGAFRATEDGFRTWRISGLRQELDEPDRSVFERAAREIGLNAQGLQSARFARRSVDARGRGADLHLVAQVELVVPGQHRSKLLDRLRSSGRVRPAPAPETLALPGLPRGQEHRGAAPHVGVIGAGPGGLFAAFAAAASGARVTLVERGAAIETRGRKVVAFHRGAAPDPDTNLLFGDGGAGTYSDGKLYTRTSDTLEPAILQALIDAGAPADIAFDARAHIGTDRLHRILPELREQLRAMGVEFVYDTCVTGLELIDTGGGRTVRGLETTRGPIAVDAVVASIGHSARDTWRLFADAGVRMEAKPFQVGVRIEHSQETITRGRYGDSPRAGLLGPASYNLQSKADPPAHSFCMCPGGRIVASVNEPGRLCTNGMSNSKHSSRWANAAIVTTLRPEEFGSLAPGLGSAAQEYGGAFAGIELQRALESRFYEAGGSTYAAPAQRADDFLAARGSTGELRTSYGFGAVPRRVDELLPRRLRDAIAEALLRFDRTIPGFASADGLLVGIETRSSGPVRIPRGREDRLAEGFTNLYPAGEGAGYAGGIMSAAIDGARAAHAAVLRGGES